MRVFNWKSVFIFAFFLLGLTVDQASTAAQSWSNGYVARRTITIDHTKVPNTDQTNFPVVFSKTLADLATTGNGGLVTSSSGYDIIFTSDAAGATPIAFEREIYNSSSGAVTYWIKVPSVSHSSDSVFYMFYGNSSVTTDQSNKTGVWDSNFVLVSHLSDNAANTTITDSTSNANNLANSSNTSSKTAAGEVNLGLTYNGSGDYSSIANNSSLNIQGSAITVEVWAKPTNTNGSNYERIVAKEVSGNADPYLRYGLIRISGSSQVNFEVSTGGAGSSASISGGAMSAGSWMHIAGVYDGSTVKLYANGSLVSSASKTGNIASSTTPLSLARDSEISSEYFNGVLDEVRISNSARSADWVATEYNNQSSPATFSSIGAAMLSLISSLSPNTGAVSTSVTITGTNFGSTAGSSTVTFNGTVATPTSWSDTQIVVPVPSGATPGSVVVTVSGVGSNSAFFMVPTSWSNGYAYRRAITINHPMVPNTNQTNFPVLVSGTYSYLANTGSAGYVTNTNGYDIIFTSDAAGSTTLAYERESYNSSTGAVNLWVKAPTVSHTATETVLYMFYGNSSVTTDQSNKTGVWDSNYVAIYHLSDNAANTTVQDSTANANTGTNPANTSTKSAAGQISNALTYSHASSDTTTIADSGSLEITGAVSFEGWIKTTDLNGTSLFLSYSNSSPYNGYGIGYGVSGVGQMSYWSNSHGSWVVSNSPVNDGVWHHVAVTVSSGGSVNFYKDGLANGTQASNIPTTYTGSRAIGATGFTGTLDEIRISKSTRAADWIAAEYNNQSSPSTFYSVWAAASSGGGSGGNPSITSLSPASGAIGATVTIAGANFNATQSDSTVTFNGSTATPTSWSDSQIVLPVPSGTTTGNVVALVSGVNSNGVSFTVVSAPSITSLSTTSAPVGAAVTITGTNFGSSQGSGTVKFNGTTASVTTWSATSIAVTVPSGASTGNVVVFASGVNSGGSSFTVLPTPSISSLAPTTGAVSASVTITGTSFGSTQGTSTVTFNGTAATPTTWSDTQIVLPVPSGATTGNVIVAANGANSNGVSFTVVSAPTITSLSTTTGAIGSAATITGTSFGASQGSGTVTFNGTTASVTSWGATSIAVTVPSGATTGNVVVYASGVNSNGTSFTVLPGITSLSITSGAVGAAVTITGTTFGATQGSGTVTFNGTTASVTTWSATSIVVTVPTGATTGNVVVVANSLTSSGVSFTVVPAPTITSLTPSSAPIGGTVVVTGTNFGATQGSGQVKFNSVVASVGSWSATSITVTVPSSAASGSVTVVASGVASNTSSFTLIEASSITSLSPTTGLIGSSVTINGTGFGATQSSSTVAFNAVAVISITSWSDTQIVAVVPVGDSPGPVSAKVAGITSQGPTFVPTLKASVTDSLGNSSYYIGAVAGGQWHPTDSQGSGCSSCTVRGTNHYGYDAYGNVTSMTDPLGNVTTNTYDSANNLLSQTAPVTSSMTATTSYTYNSIGEVLTVTDALGKVTTNVYDTHGNLTSVTSPAPDGSTAASVTHFAYNSLGELTSITDPLSNVTTMTYTTAGLIHTITDAQSNVTTYAYDSHGNRTSVTDALTHATTFAYDSGDRLTTITYPDSTTSTFAYDSRGRRTSVTDQNSKTTTYAYDSADRLTSVTDAASNATTYAYDTENNLTEITDASSHSTFFTYDAYGRVTNTNFPSSTSETYAYDADNNLTSKTDRKSQTISYVYDALNRLTSKTYPDSTAAAYTYDLVGKVTQVNDPTGTYAFAYDNMGRLTGTTTSYSFLTRSFTNAYTYDAASNRTWFTDPESGSTTYAYDTLNRLTTLGPPSAFTTGSFGFSYDALSRRTQMTRPNSVATNYTYDNLSRLSSVLHQVGGGTIDGASYTVNSGGNRTAKVDQLAALTSNYTYDALYQLTQATQGATTTESYTYDAVGNRTASLGVSSYTTNASNQMTATSGASYTYDSNGNTLTKVVSSNTTTYAWDYENRLTSVTLPGSGGTVTFKYDSLGRRIYKSSSAGTSVFAYDGDNIVEEANSSGTVVARYAQTQNIDEPLAMLRSSTTTYYQADGLGSVTSLSNGAGALAQTYSFDSFGKTTPTGSVVNPFQYTGREFDSETGLYYYRARYYDPTTGRFLSEDPSSFKAGINFYAYVRNGPVDLVDGYGLQCKPLTPYQKWINDQNRPATDAERLDLLKPAGQMADAGVKAGLAVAAFEASVVLGTAAAFGTVALTAAQAVGAAAETYVGTAASAAAATFVGGVSTVQDFVKGVAATNPGSIPLTPGGAVGAGVRLIYDTVIKSLF